MTSFDSQSTNEFDRANLSEDELRSYLAFAQTLADAAGETVLPYFRAELDVLNKDGTGGFDPVTQADRAAEKVMRTRLAETYPDHGIIGEEFDNQASTSPFTWILDPIDGTRGFVAGVPQWGTLIALCYGHRPVVGIIDQPYVKERFLGVHAPALAEARLIAQTRARALGCRPCTGLEAAVMSCTTPAMFEGKEREAYEQIEKRCQLVRYSLDCYAYGLMSLGTIDLVIESGMAAYDIAALIPVVEAAGGILTDWYGNAYPDSGQIVAAGDARVHEQALELLRPAAG